MALKQVKTSSSKNIVKFGPIGAIFRNMDTWEDRMGEGGAELVQIFISFGNCSICSLQFLYLKNGKYVLTEKHGGDSANSYHAISFDYPNEYLTSVIGTSTYHSTSKYINSITSITFFTNLSTYGPFGNSGSTSNRFEFNLGNARQFCGFFGSTFDGCISSIGMYVDPLCTPNIQQTQCDQSVEENQLVLYSPN